MFGFGQTKKITEKLYEQNLELAVKNKTLSLLEKLYQTSVLSLTPEEMAKEITDNILIRLNLEFAGVLKFEKDSDSLISLSFSKSERLTKTLNKLGVLFSEITITNVSKSNFLKKAAYDRKDGITNNLQEVWDGLIKPEHLHQIKKESHIKTILIDPLIIDKEVFGVLLLGLNRDYNTLNTFEKASVRSFINVIGLLLDKAYLYKNLQESYEVTKKAYAIEKQAKEELQKLDVVKNQFVQQTQHDLRTPLTSIMGYSDLILNGMFGKQNKKTLEVIKKLQVVAQNMIRKVNDFLDVTQFQLGKNPVSLKPNVELAHILDEVVNELNFTAQNNEVSLTLEKPKENFIIKADKEKLKAALFNIVDNAIKYAPKGRVTISIQLTIDNLHLTNDVVSNVKGQMSNVLIKISDTGIGMSGERLKTLFTQMFERDEKAKETASGKGAGLYLATQVIKAHNGKIWAESEGEGKGSIFYIELPLDLNSNSDTH